MWILIGIITLFILISAIFLPNGQFSGVYLGQYNNVNDFVDEMINTDDSK